MTRTFEFPAGHRLMNHEGACRDLHGHNYQVDITCEGDRLDAVGRVVDFDVLKERVHGWILVNWDHGFLLNRADAEVAASIGRFCKNGRAYLMDVNPTAENIAIELHGVAERALREYDVRVVRVCVQEMAGCTAVFEPGPGAA